MAVNVASEVEIQQRYYAESAHKYSEMHDQDDDGHYLALLLLVATIDYFGIKSILDVGSGTGRAVSYVKKKCPGIKIVGIEPVKELREVGYQNGLSREDLVEGDALKLAFRDGEFDMVCEFGMLHHVRNPPSLFFWAVYNASHFLHWSTTVALSTNPALRKSRRPAHR